MDGFAALTHTMEQVAREMDGAAARARLARVGKASTGDVESAVRGALGDLSMSGWPIDVIGGAAVLSDHELAIAPVPKARGPMRVLEQGRNQGNAGGMAGPGVTADGTTRRTKSGGVRKTRARQSRQWNGVTQGKGTWSDATATLAREMPARYEAELAADLAKHLRRG